MSTAKSNLLKILFLTILAVALGPIYFHEYLSPPISANTLPTPPPWVRMPKPREPVVVRRAGNIRLVLHVGLPKTATSAIQCRISDMERHDMLPKLSAKIVEIESCRTNKFLHKVRIEQYLETFPTVTKNEILNQSTSETSQKYTTYERVIKGESVLQHCLDVWIKHVDTAPIPDCWGMSYQKYIRNYHDQNYSIFIISNENLLIPPFGSVANPQVCGTIFDNMLDSLGQDSEIDIVLTQRLHFDRMISMMGQEYDGEKFFSRQRLSKWPGEGGDEVPHLEKYISDFPVEKFTQGINCFRYATKNNPRVHFKVLDFHNRKKDIVTSFLDVITRNNTLTAEVGERWTVGKENMAMERDSRIHFDRVAIAAKMAGMFPNSLARNEGRNAVSEYFKKKELTIKDMKLKCPSDEFFDELIKTTALIHQMSFPEEPNDVIKKKLRMFDFPPFRDIFCEVDGNATLHDEVMKDFISQQKSS